MISKLANKDTLDFLGERAQYSITKSLVENKSLFMQVSPYLNTAAFTEPTLQSIISLVKSEYDRTGVVIGWRDIEYRLKEKLRTDDEMNTFKNAITRLKSDDTDGLQTATEVGINHLKTLEFKRILKNAIEYLKNGGYTEDRAANLVEQVEAIEKVNTNEDSLDVDGMFEYVMAHSSTEKVPTGIGQIDAATNGGIPKGNIALVIAGTGVGKTTFGSHMVMKAALAGSKVAHLFFEDTIAEIGRKYYSTLTGRYTKEYETDDAETKEILRKEIMGNEEWRAALARIKPKRMRNGEDRVEDVINYIRHLIAQGFKPDMVVLDYMSCLKLTSDRRDAVNREYELLEKAMKKLECFAQDEGIAIWVEQQTNRDGQKSETKNDRMGNIQGSFRMTQPAAFIFYLQRSEVDKTNRADLFMDKCRGCVPTAWTNFLMNNGTCQIDLNNMDDGGFIDDVDNRFKAMIDNEVF